MKPYKKIGEEAESDHGTDNEDELIVRKKKTKRKQSTDVGTNDQSSEPKRKRTKKQIQDKAIGKRYHPIFQLRQ